MVPDDQPKEAVDDSPGASYFGWAVMLLVIAGVAWFAFAEARLMRTAILLAVVNVGIGLYKNANDDRPDNQ